MARRPPHRFTPPHFTAPSPPNVGHHSRESSSTRFSGSLKHRYVKIFNAAQEMARDTVTTLFRWSERV
ncbi:unnamed protein product [Linum trigynum]|uniref:Uncharacterized protein n=1 Tax=Linum trigynum TaxID=586398 RepID=A0AAV2EVW3_9ROSI